MVKEIVRIDELRLRVPGMKADEGCSFGEDMVRRLAKGLPQEIQSRQLGALHLRVKVPEGTPRNQIADMVVKAILRGLK